MPRKARIDAPAALHHIIIRGIERKAIFKDKTDRVNFFNRLSRIISETETGCHSWVLRASHLLPVFLDVKTRSEAFEPPPVYFWLKKAEKM